MYFDDEESRYVDQKPKEVKRCVRVVIEGPKVQGVGFRQWMVGKALGLEIDGWVRNNGQKVEAIFVGSIPAVSEIIQLCYYGPPLATVKKVKEFPFAEGDSNIDEGFRQLPTI